MHELEKRILLPEDLEPVSSLKAYQEQGGLEGLKKARSMDPEKVTAEVMAAGLRGRGGAGFPTAIKWQTVSRDPAPRKFVVCNAAEGEPGTFKDRYLISKNPYLVFEGMLIVAHVIGAEQAIIATKERFHNTLRQLSRAIREFEEAGLIEPGYLRLVEGPDEYLLGEEKAMMEVIDGRDAMPRYYPPFMVGVGVTPTDPNPTVVNNVETMSHLPLILSRGADWFRSNGFEDTPGTMILTLSGDIKHPGMYEVGLGLSVREFLYDLGGGPSGDKPIKAVFSGVSNRVMTPDQFDLPMGFGTLREAGIGLGSGGFIVYDESRDMVEVAHMFSRFLSISSCGQCVPCKQGTGEVTEYLEKILMNRGSEHDMALIRDVCGRCTSQTRCFLPTQESIVIPSIIDTFPDEFETHIRGIRTAPGDIRLPKIDAFDESTGKFYYQGDPDMTGVVC